MSPRSRSTRQSQRDTAALFVRIPTDQARRLDRAAFELGRPKQELISGLVERYVDPDSPRSLARLAGDAGRGQPKAQAESASAGPDDDRRRVTIETLEPGALTVGHHSFRPREPEVLTAEEAAELLQVDPALVLQLAEAGELPGRRLGSEWRFARAALLAWLARGEDAGTGPAKADR